MRAILSKTTTDLMKSKILSNELSLLVFDVYINPKDFADIIERFNETEFELEIKPITNDTG